MLLVSLTGCSVLIRNVYEKRSSSPVIVSFDEKSTPVWSVPFPAVTICSESKMQNSKVNFEQWFKLISDQKLSENDTKEENYKTIEALTHVCDYSLFENITFNSGIKSENIAKYLYESSSNLSSVLDFCRWKNKIVECQELFREILTDEGNCFTFNSLSLSQIYSDER